MKTKPHIQIIQGSTRHGTNAPKVAQWMLAKARAREDMTVELLDLREWNLPIFAEPFRPSEGRYQYDHTKRWSAAVQKGDGYIIITPEYNHGYPGGLKNAIDYLYHEWVRKPVAFVSYGGQVGGARSVEQLRQVVVDLQMAPVHTALHIPFIDKAFDAEGKLNPKFDGRAEKLFQDLLWWARLLKLGREEYP